MIVAMLAIGTAMPALAQAPCPVQSQEADAVAKAIGSAANCRVSFDIMRACSNSDGSDALLAAAVIDKCEATFLQRLSADRKHHYQQVRESCVRKFANMDGTVYASYQATCEAAVAVRYSWRWGN
jgi:hypothetical protein